MQFGPLFADIRIPASRPKLDGAAALDAFEAPALLTLMQAEGFAGTATVDKGVCTWQRRINWHGVPERVDARRMSFEAAGTLREDGIHADYTEMWQQIPERPVKAHFVRWAGLEGVVVFSRARFLVGVGLPGAPASGPLIAVLEMGRMPKRLLTEHFRSVYAFGEWDGERGRAVLATNPFLEGQEILCRCETGYSLASIGFTGQQMQAPLELFD